MNKSRPRATRGMAITLLLVSVFSIAYGTLNWNRTNIAPPLTLSGAFFAAASVYWICLYWSRSD